MEQYLRCALELAVVLPAAVFAFLPVRKQLRFRVPVVCAASGAVLLVFILAGARLCAGYGWGANRALPLGAPLLLAAYLAAVQMKTAKKLFSFFTATLLIGWCSMYTSFIVAPFETRGEVFSLRSSMICFGLIAVLGGSFYLTLSYKLPYLFEEERLDPVWRYFTLVPLFLAALVYWMSPLDPANVTVGRVRIISLVIMLFIPLVFFAFCYLLWWLTKSLVESTRLQEENNILQIERKRYEALQSYMDETRALRHDFRQHLAVIERLHRTGDDESLSEYLRQLHAAAEGKHKRYCGNRAVDALAAHYDALADEQNALIEWLLDLPEHLILSDMEYCAMLGNLVENALHAVEKLPMEKRRVKVGSQQSSDSILTLCVDNPYEGTVKLGRDGLPRARRAGHGVGLASVAATVHRYDGTIALRTEGGLFSVDIVLYAPQDAEA